MLLVAFIVNVFLVTAAVIIHYEILRLLSKLIPRLQVKHRLRVVIGVFGTICAHVVEIWLFALAFYLMLLHGGFGDVIGVVNGSLLDCVYFSFVNYTTVGYGDMIPTEHLRFLVGLEAITGLSLITWSASFMFVEMTKFWEDEG